MKYRTEGFRDETDDENVGRWDPSMGPYDPLNGAHWR